MTTNSPTQPPEEKLLEALVELLYSLPEDAVFQVGMDQILKVQSLLVSLAAQGALPSDPQRLCYLVAPVVCTTPAEQDEFYRRFQQILPQLEPSSEATQHKPLQREVARERWRLVTVVIVGVAAWFAGSMWHYHRQYKLSESRRAALHAVMPELPKQAVFNPTNVHPEQGRMKVAVQSPQAGEVIETPHVVAGPIPPDPPAWYWAWLKWLLPITAFLMLAVAYRKWRQRRIRLFLERQQTTERPSIVGTAQIEVADHSLFLNANITTVSRQLRRRVTLPSTRLDVEATVDRTSINGGRFSPEFDTRQVSPEYLVLVERVAAQDHLADLVGCFLTRLKNEEVHYERYWYVGHPEYCQGEHQRRPVRLQELLNQNPEARLLVCGRARAFFNSFNGRPAKWTELVEGWTQRVLLTTDPLTEWGYQEWSLSQSGFVVLPLSLKGIGRMGQRFDPDERLHSIPVEYAPKLPKFITERWDEWSSPEPPNLANCATLIEELRSYLGQRLLVWFSACAIYPEITWELTLYLGQKLTPELCTESNLVTLARLPWMRTGSIPDWLRRLLIGLLSEEDVRQARYAIDLILLSAIRGDTTSQGLQIAAKDRGWLSQVSRQFVRQQLKSDSDSEDLQDVVFANFVSQSPTATTTYAVSQKVSRLLHERLNPPQKRSFLRRIGRGIVLALVAIVLTIPVGIVVAFIKNSGSSRSITLPDDLDASIAGPGYGSNLKVVVGTALDDLKQRRTESFVKNMLSPRELSYLAAVPDGLEATIDIIEFGAAPNFGVPNEVPSKKTITEPLQPLMIADLEAIQDFLKSGGEPTYNAERTVATFVLSRSKSSPPIEPKIKQAAFQQNKPPADADEQYAVTVRFQLVNASWRFFDGADEIRRVQRGIVD